MKKILPLLLCLLLLASCTVQPSEEQPPAPPAEQPAEPPTEQPAELPEEQPDDVPDPEQPQPPTEDIPAEEAAPSEEGEPFDRPAEISAILETREGLDAAGLLWYLPNERVESGLQQDIRLYQGKLLLSGSAAGEDGTPVQKLCLLSLDTGEVLHETVLSGFDVPDIGVCGDTIVVTDWLGSRVLLLDGSLRVVGELDAKSEVGAVYLSPDLTTLYCFDSENGIRITELASGQERVILQEAASLYASGRCGNAVSFFYTDQGTQLSCLGILDLTTGETTMLPFDGAFGHSEYSEGVWLADPMGRDGYFLGRAERPMAFVLTEQYSTVSMLSEPARLFATSYGEDGVVTLRLYDLDGSFLSACTMPQEIAGVFGDPVWSAADGGYYLAAIEQTGRDLLLFWDFSAPVSGESLQLTPAYEQENSVGTALPETLYNRATNLSETYGVTVRIADLCDTTVNEFAVAQELDADYVTAGLDMLEQVLACYPEGFFSQLRYGSQQSLEIQLSGALTKTTLTPGSTGFTSFTGFTAEREGKTVIVVNIAAPGSITQTMHHEIMHVIDNKLSFAARLREDALYSEAGWTALNPTGFAYADDYNDLPADFYNDGYDMWFTELYSRTFAKEDRATIMEYAMVGSDWMFTAAPGRLAKLDYLCRCIRDAFDTTGWPAYTVWEYTLSRCGG